MRAKAEIELIDSVGGLWSEPGGRAERPAGGAPARELPAQEHTREMCSTGVPPITDSFA